MPGGLVGTAGSRWTVPLSLIGSWRAAGMAKVIRERLMKQGPEASALEFTRRDVALPTNEKRR